MPALTRLIRLIYIYDDSCAASVAEMANCFMDCVASGKLHNDHLPILYILRTDA